MSPGIPSTVTRLIHSLAFTLCAISQAGRSQKSVIPLTKRDSAITTWAWGGTNSDHHPTEERVGRAGVALRGLWRFGEQQTVSERRERNSSAGTNVFGEGTVTRIQNILLGGASVIAMGAF